MNGRAQKYRNAKFVVSCGLLLCILIAADLITKWLAAATNISQGSYFLGIVRLHFTTNPGIAFGLASDNPTIMLLIIALTVALMFGIAIVFFTLFKRNAPVRVCLTVIEAGALGNLIDRLILGHVRDMIDLSPIRLGVCNVADFCIVLGAVALCFVILFIGSHAVFPLTKKWREQAKREEAERERAKSEHGERGGKA